MKSEYQLRTLQQIMGRNKFGESNYFDDVFILFLYRKIIRISEGLYLITNHINDNEPIKNQIRNCSIEIVGMSVRIKKQKNTEEEIVLYNNLLVGIANLLALLEVAAVAGVINRPNYFLLDREISSVFGIITEKIKNYGHLNVSVTPSFFDVEIGTAQIQSKKNLEHKGHIIKDKTEVSNKKLESIKDNESSTADFSETIVSKTENNKQLEPSNKTRIKDISRIDKGHVNQKDVLRTIERESKDNLVLNLLKNNKQVSIKDIIVSLPQYSKKTIQRELLKLVKGGFVIKEGQKRWTSYSVVNKG